MKTAGKLANSSVFKIHINHWTVVSILRTSSDKYTTLLIVHMIYTIHDMTSFLFYVFQLHERDESLRGRIIFYLIMMWNFYINNCKYNAKLQLLFSSAISNFCPLNHRPALYTILKSTSINWTQTSAQINSLYWNINTMKVTTCNKWFIMSVLCVFEWRILYNQYFR